MFILYYLCALFVKLVCWNRDYTHGYVHMKAVADKGLQIAKSLRLSDRLMQMVCVCGFLHDVLDHKYRRTEEYQEKYYNWFLNLLRFLFRLETNVINNIIQRVSFSYEIKNKKKENWEDLLGQYLIVRDIISDADKLEAIGVDGIQRCIQYTIGRGTIDFEDIKTNVVEHYKEKLSILYKDGFFKTEMGQTYASVLDSEMTDFINGNGFDSMIKVEIWRSDSY